MGPLPIRHAQAFPPPPPGQSRLPQSVISGIIAGMWKEATPETRLEYKTSSKMKDKIRLRLEREAQKAHRKQMREIASPTRRNSRRDLPPSLLTTMPLPGQASTTVTTPSTQYSTPSSSTSATMLPTLRLSPYPLPPYPPPNAFRTDTSSASQCQQPLPSYAQPQQPSPPHAQQPSPSHVRLLQQVECGVSPDTLQTQGSSSYELTILLSARPVPDLTVWDLSSLGSRSYEPVGDPTNDPLCFIFGMGDCCGNEQIFDDPCAIRVNGLSLMGDMVGQGDLSNPAELFDSLIQYDPDFSNVAGPSQLNPPSSHVNHTAHRRHDPVAPCVIGASELVGCGPGHCPASLAPEVQPEV